MKNKIAVFVATWFWTGLSPWASGTVGSLFSLPLCCPLVWLCWSHPIIGGGVYIATMAAVMLLGLWSVPLAEKKLGPMKDYKRIEKKRDQNQIVIDEVLGMLFACLPIAFHPGTPWWLFAAAFGAFRLFDIWKPWPADRLHRIKTAWGVMMDDVAAGVWTALLVVWLLL